MMTKVNYLPLVPDKELDSLNKENLIGFSLRLVQPMMLIRQLTRSMFAFSKEENWYVAQSTGSKILSKCAMV